MRSILTWHNGTVLIDSDSMFNNRDETRLSKNKNIKVNSFGCVKIKDMYGYLTPLFKKPFVLILHVGTNDAATNTSDEILDEILDLKNHVENVVPGINGVISKMIRRSDNRKANAILGNIISLIRTMRLNSKSNPLMILSPLSNSRITSPDLGISVDVISHGMHTPMDANAKPFVMIKNIDINASMGNLNILGTNTNLSMGDISLLTAIPYETIPSNCYTSVNIIVNSSNNMLNPRAKLFSLASTSMNIAFNHNARVFSLDTIRTSHVLNPCA